MIFKMLPVLLMCHYDNPLHLEKAHSDRPMRHSFIWCAYGAWRGPNLITAYGVTRTWGVKLTKLAYPANIMMAANDLAMKESGHQESYLFI